MKLVRDVLLALLSGALGAAVTAQCGVVFAPGTGGNGTDGTVQYLTSWDPDGAGPATPRLVMAGPFTAAGPFAASGLAAWDPATGLWSTFAPAVGNVKGLAVLPNGDLVVARSNYTVTPVSQRVERWTGSAWTQLGANFAGEMTGLLVLPNGTLVASAFANGGVLSWNGTSWSQVGGGPAGSVVAIAGLPNGNLAASSLLSLGFGYVVLVWQWNGASWTQLGASPDSSVAALVGMPNGDLVAAGSFSTIGGTPAARIARWNGTTWSALGAGTNATVYTLLALGNGDLLAGGEFTQAGGLAAPKVARWDGTSWSPVIPAGLQNGALSTSVQALGLTPQGLAIGGVFRFVAGVPAQNVALQALAGWTALAQGRDSFDGPVHAIAALPGGGHVVGGNFTATGGVPTNNLAQWNGTAWGPLGTGTDGTVRAVVVLTNGDVVAAGDFANAGGVPCNGIARWDGAAWHALPPGVMSAPVRVLCVLPNGDLVAGNGLRIARWNGVAWTVLGSGPNAANSLTTLANGDLVGAGSFTMPNQAFFSCVARWTGSAWVPFSPLDGNPAAVVRMPNGDLVTDLRTSFGMGFTSVFQRWNGTAWSNLGPAFFGGATALLATPDGDLMVDRFGPQRVDGGVWTVVAGGTNGQVRAMTTLPDGDVLVGGDFTLAGGQSAPHFARLASTCRATSGAAGAGCAGSAGPLQLTTTALPWLGGTFRATTTGVAPQSVGFAVTSLSPATVPLAQVLPVGVPGCLGLVGVDLGEIVLPTAGRIDSTIALPDDPAFVGLVLYHYLAVLEFTNGALTALVGSNRLQLTLGVF